jgi:hypothetical protein
MKSPQLMSGRGRFTAVAVGAAVVLTLAGSAVAAMYDRPGTAAFADTLSFAVALAAVAVVGAVVTSARIPMRTGWLAGEARSACLLALGT